MSETSETKKPKSSKSKRWYAVKWTRANATRDCPVIIPRGTYQSFDTSLENAEARIARAMIDTQNNYVPADGLIYKIGHIRGIKETELGNIVSRGLTSVSDTEFNDLIKDGEAIYPKVNKETIPSPVDIPSFDKVAPTQCFVAIIEVDSPVSRYSVGILATSVLNGINTIYEYMERNAFYPDSARIRGDKVFLADAIDNSLAKKLNESKEPIDVIDCFQETRGFNFPATDINAMSNALFINKDEEYDVAPHGYPVPPEGRFEKYREKIAKMESEIRRGGGREI